MLIDTYSEHTHRLSMATAGLLARVVKLVQAVFPKKCQ